MTRSKDHALPNHHDKHVARYVNSLGVGPIGVYIDYYVEMATPKP
jgi:hypothetical protein